MDAAQNQAYLNFLNSGAQPGTLGDTYFGSFQSPSLLGISPRDIRLYGADPTGVRDSTTAINAALDFGGAIYAPPGVYHISAPLFVSQNGTYLFGGGSGNTSILSTSGSQNIIQFIDQTNFCRFTGMTLGNANSVTPTAGTVITGVKCEKTLLHDLIFNNFWNGFYTYRGGTYMSELIFQNPVDGSEFGVFIEEFNTDRGGIYHIRDTKVTGGSFSGFIGFKCVAATSLHFDRTHAETCDIAYLFDSDTDGNTCSFLHAMHMNGENANYGIVAKACSRGSIVASQQDGHNVWGMLIGCDTSLTPDATAAQLTIVGTTINNGDEGGVYIAAGRNELVGCSVQANSKAANSGVYPGLEIAGGENQITGGRYGGDKDSPGQATGSTQKYGIQIDSAVSTLQTINGPDLRGNVTAPFHNASTNDVVRLGGEIRGLSTGADVIASATALTLGYAKTVQLTGTTGVTSIVFPGGGGGPAWDEIVFISTDGTVAFTAGTGIGNSFTTTQNKPCHAKFYSGKYYLS